MKIEIDTSEAQALLDGINVVIQEKRKDIAVFENMIRTQDKETERTLDQLKGECIIAERARAKVQVVA